MSPRPLLLAAWLALSGCAANGLTGDTFRPAVYVVRPGDTLYSIAWRYGLDHQELARWNALDSPDRLSVGQRLRLSPRAQAARAEGGGESPEQRSSRGEREAATRAEPESEGEASSDAPERVAAGEQPSGDEPNAWRWPAEGALLGEFGGDGVAGRGIELGGEMGTGVRAAADGEVVYSGEGLQAYGQLVIIRHGGSFLSAYAHNNRLHVEEGQQVQAGQQIAGMGRTNDGEVLLHFEIRRQGTPVDPLDFLPARE